MWYAKGKAIVTVVVDGGVDSVWKKCGRDLFTKWAINDKPSTIKIIIFVLSDIRFL